MQPDGEEPPPFSMYTIAEEFGLTNDAKQMAAFEVICSTFVLQVLNEAAATNAMRQATAAALGAEQLGTVEQTRTALKRLGGQTQLRMFLTGAGGCGKSHVIFAARKFCHRFSQRAGVIFDANTFFLTAYVGSAAAIWGGITTHTAAHMNKKRVTDAQLKEWENVRILVVDEVSYFSKTDLETLDRKLRRLKRRGDAEYGGVHIVFAGDLRQLEPVRGKPFYHDWCACWQGSLNCAIILENNHRFKDDPEYGHLLARIRSNTHTAADIEAINSRFIRDASDLPDQGQEVCYACSTNKERNAVSESMFRTCIQESAPVESDEPPSDGVVVIEAVMRNKNTVATRSFHDAAFEMCGDAQVQTSRKKRVDPALKWYPGIPLMITSNDDIKKGRANGSLCRGLSIKLKEGTVPRWKNYDGRKVTTVGVNDCEYMLCENWEAEEKDRPPKKFKLTPEADTYELKMPMQAHIIPFHLNITQFGVISCIGTTGHKLQGMSKDNIIVTSWNYGTRNWIYVVLSRVRTLAGLHLLQKLNDTVNFSPHARLLEEERRLKQLEAAFFSNGRQLPENNE
jgi:hypothetical protein